MPVANSASLFRTDELAHERIRSSDRMSEDMGHWGLGSWGFGDVGDVIHKIGLVSFCSSHESKPNLVSAVS